MKKKLFGFFRTNRKGLALISVLGVVTLATILILALFSVSDAEFKSAKNYADGALARQLADNSVNLVISQIQAAATGAGAPGGGGQGKTIWASQPGGVRVYRGSGIFLMGRKLYSSSQMVLAGTGPSSEETFGKSKPAAGWNAQPTQWVDLNEPVVRVPSSAPAGAAPRTYFPIVDPRATRSLNGVDAVEGFSYSKEIPFPAGGQVDGVVETGELDDLRVPMPVEWLYVLKDGSMGTMVGSKPTQGSWAGVTGSGTPSKQNPIVGRVAFWTDDETCRVNINTAGEPGFFATPTVFHGRDWNWSNCQPAIFEFQRYPGHPATVALSSVLYPNPNHSPGKYDSDSYPGFPPNFLELKNKLCELAPRLAPGGSADGTLSYAPDDFSSNVIAGIDNLWANIQASASEHPFVSVDELIFKNKQTASDSREKITLMASGVPELVSPELLERDRFFLTAQSRAPEINMFGYPRVAIWPVPDDSLGPKFRTAYDSAMAFAGSLGSPANAYYFRRRDANSALADIGRDSTFTSSGLSRNGQLMSYLDSMITSSGIYLPGSNAPHNFKDKYDIDAHQILIEIFDYIRITNLYDSFLDEQYVKDRGGKRDFWDDQNPPEPGARLITIPAQQSLLWSERPKEFTYYTYTAPRFDTMRRVGDLGNVPAAYTSLFKNERVTTGMYPGHGQVRPIEWSHEGQVYRGLGRFPTISEVALHFICTGDGKPDAGSYTLKHPISGEEVKSGGKTAKRIDEDVENRRVPYAPDGKDLFFYSNIPPYPNYDLFTEWGCTFGGNTNSPNSWTKHPGSNPRNWNLTLETANGPDGQYGIPLKEDEKRIQIALEIELFVPALGYTKYAPDFTIVMNKDELANLLVDDGENNYKSVFDSNEDLVVQSSVYYTGSALGEAQGLAGVTPVGGSYGANPLMQGRAALALRGMPKDSAYNDKSAKPDDKILNFPLVSNFFTVKRNKAINFKNRNNRPLKIELYASHYREGKNATPSQTVFVSMPPGSTPTPKLVVYSTERRKYVDSAGNQVIRNAVNAPRWWAFNASGALFRLKGSGAYVPGGGAGGGRVIWSTLPNTIGGTDPLVQGRFTTLSNTSTPSVDKYNKYFPNKDANIPMSSVIYGYSPLDAFKGVQSHPADLPNEDGFQDEPGGMGNYPCYGADCLRSLMPEHGDYRILAGRPQVSEEVFKPHRLWLERKDDLFAHNLSNQGSPENGFDTGATSQIPEDAAKQWATYRMVPGAWYPPNQVPDTPMTLAASNASIFSGDFDNGPGDIHDGPYINKADDGNLSVGQLWYGASTQLAVTRNAYFLASYLQFPSRGSFFTPNRLLASPGMFGSLPTGVYGSGGNQKDKQTGIPWRTLLFRPAPVRGHYGSPKIAPADHYFLDLFWMPIVQPYAISDSFSTAGKINLNYQMLGFPHITRATALHAAMKGEMISAFSSQDADPRKAGGGRPSVNNTIIYKTAKNPGNVGANSAIDMWGSGDNMDWHRHINIPATLRQCEDRFYFAGGALVEGSFQGLFRTASQVCELHLVPVASVMAGRAVNEGISGLDGGRTTTTGNIKNAMETFWNYNNITGDNTRERPYTNLYQKLTTRSNTYRVYFMAQSIKKARSVEAGTFDSTKDSVTAEYRGSALIERYLDFTSAEAGGTAFPDYVAGVSGNGTTSPFTQDSLETKYHYRVLEMKQFSP